MAISNKKTGQQIGNLSTSSNKSHVNPSKEMYKIISEADENSLTMVHNHPKNPLPLLEILLVVITTKQLVKC